MALKENIRARVAEMSESERAKQSAPATARAVSRASAPLALVNIEAITHNVKTARKVEPLVAPIQRGLTKAIGHVRADSTISPAEKDKRIEEVNARARDDISKLIKEIDDAAPLMEAQKEWYTQRACLTRAVFDKDPGVDAQIRTGLVTRCARLNGPQLIDAMRLAVSRSDAATAGVVNDELAARSGLPDNDLRTLSREHRVELAALIESVQTDSQSALALIAEHELIGRRVRIAAGRATSRDRIAAGLMAREQGK